MKKILILLATITFFLSINASAREQIHQRSNLDIQIDDLSYVSYPIEDFFIGSITSATLKMTINHSRPSDLLVSIVSPSGAFAIIHNMEEVSGSTLNISVDSNTVLKNLIGSTAIGRFEIQIFDQLSGEVGVLKDISFVLKGQNVDYSVVNEIPIITATSCGDMWNEILLQTDIEPMYKDIVYSCGETLKRGLKEIIKNNKNIGYTSARKIMFKTLDNVAGRVCSVYSDKCISTKDIPSNLVMNCEHTWPQSKGATGIAKSDLHHLFPAMKKENGDRSNFPFCEDSYNKADIYGKIVNKGGRPCYEPPRGHKGDVARSMFYFSVRYDKKINSREQSYFRLWNREDPVSGKESARNDKIEDYQNNRNPFVDHPEFIDLINSF